MNGLLRPLVVGVLLGAGGALHAAEPRTLDARTGEPRAFGYQVGDLVQRRVWVDLPEGLVLDEASLPKPGARGRALELRALRRTSSGGREALEFEYQVFLSPPAARTLELPPLLLRFDGQPRVQELRIDAWPVTVAPLVPPEVSSRRGLGELQPDAEAPPLDTRTLRQRLLAEVVAAVSIAATLAFVYFGAPWWNRHHRPFARAWRQLRGLSTAAPDAAAWRVACERLHAAFNESGGEVLFEHGIERFAARRPGFAALRGDMQRFLAISRRGFFGDGTREHGDLAWLIGFGRRCRDAERWS